MEQLAFSIPQFCERHDISRALFYKLLKEGRGPAVMKAGRRTLISTEAAASWRRRMETSGGEADADADAGTLPG